MKSSVTKYVKACVLVVIGVTIGVAGIYIGEADDAPGGSVINHA